MRIAIIQMQTVAGDVATNRKQGLAMAAEAAGQADIVVLPELWTTGYALRQVNEQAEDDSGATISGIVEIARHHKVTVVAGSLPLWRGGKIYNTTAVINSAGEVISHYEKMHLFSMTGEQRFFTAGSSRSIFSLGDVVGGIAICYDLRFPELFRSLTMEGAQIIFLPAEWPTARAEHWNILNRARAIENQVYICAVNCVGEFHGKPFYGHSMLIGPSGELVAEGGDEQEIIYGDFDPELVTKVRQSMQIWQDRRSELYL
jgi:predicted amidohydrolase